MIIIFSYKNTEHVEIERDNQLTGEELIYIQNINQKKNNSINLQFTFNNETYLFANYGYNTSGNTIICLILKINSLLIFNWKTKTLIGIYSLPNSFAIDSSLFNYEENRCFIKKYFTHLSFLNLNQNTNTLVVNESNDLFIVSSLNRKLFYFGVIRDKSNDNCNEPIHYHQFTLESLIHQITKYHIDNQMKLTIDGIDECLINRINSNSLNMIDVSFYDFNKNYALIIKDYNNDDKELVSGVIIYFLFYVVNTKIHQHSFLIYQITVSINNNKNELLLKYSGSPRNIIIKEGNSLLEKRTVESLLSKAGVFNGDNYIINVLTFSNDSFEIIIINLKMLSYKRLSSNEWLNRSKIVQSKDVKVFISDVFLIENEGMIVIVMNFIYIFIVNIHSFNFALFSINNKVSYNLDLNEVFKGEYNKCLFISLRRIKDKNTKRHLKEERDQEYQMKIVTKKITKSISLTYNQYTFNNNKNDVFNYSSAKSNNNLEALPMICLSNKNIYYRHLHYITNLYHSWKNVNYESYHCFSYEYLCLLYEHNSQLLIDNFKSKVDQLNAVHYLNIHHNSGLFLNYFHTKVSTIKYQYFIDSLNFTQIEELYFNDLVLKEEEAISDTSPNDCVIPSYQIILKNNFMLHYFIYWLLMKMFDEKRNMKELTLIINGSSNNRAERQYVYTIIKQYINKKCLNLNYDSISLPFEHQKKYLNKIRHALKTINKSNGIILLFDLVTKSYKYKDLSAIASFTLYLILHFLINSKSCQYTFSKFYISDIIINLTQNNSHANTHSNFDTIFSKYFTRKHKGELQTVININNDPQITQYLAMFLILYLYKKVNFLLTKSNQNNLIIFICLLKNINRLLSNSNFQINDKLCNSNQIHSKEYSVNHKDKWKKTINQCIIQLIINFDKFKETDSYVLFLFCFNIKTDIENYQKLIIENYFLCLNQNIESILMNILSIINSSLTNKFRQKTHTNNDTQINYTFIFESIILNKSNNEFCDTDITLLWTKLLSILQTSFLFINFTLKQNKSNCKDVFNYLIKGNKTNNNNNIQASKAYLRLSNCIKKYLALLYCATSFIQSILIFNKKILEEANEGMQMCQCLMLLSFINQIQYPDAKSLFANEIIDYMYYCTTQLITNHSFFEMFFVYNSITIGNNIQQAKIDDIIHYIKTSNNGSINSLLALNKKRESFFISIVKEELLVKDKYQSIFAYFNSNDTLFDSFLMRIRETLCNKTLTSKSIAKQYVQYSNGIKEESQAVFNQLNHWLDFKAMFTCDQMVYDSTNDDIRDKKIRANNAKVIEKIYQQGVLNKRLSIESKQEIKDQLESSRREQVNDDNQMLEIEDIELRTNNNYQDHNKDRSNSLVEIIEGSYIQQNKSEIITTNDKVYSDNTQYTDESILKSNNTTSQHNKQKKSKTKEDKHLFNSMIQKTSSNDIMTYNTNVILDKVDAISFRNQRSELEMKKKYIAIKLIIRVLNDRHSIIQDYVYKTFKAKFYINQTNAIDKQITIEIKDQKNNKSIRTCSVISEVENDLPFKLLGKTIYPKLKIKYNQE